MKFAKTTYLITFSVFFWATYYSQTGLNLDKYLKPPASVLNDDINSLFEFKSSLYSKSALLLWAFEMDADSAIILNRRVWDFFGQYKIRQIYNSDLSIITTIDSSRMAIKSLVRTNKKQILWFSPFDTLSTMYEYIPFRKYSKKMIGEVNTMLDKSRQKISLSADGCLKRYVDSIGCSYDSAGFPVSYLDVIYDNDDSVKLSGIIEVNILKNPFGLSNFTKKYYDYQPSPPPLTKRVRRLIFFKKTILIQPDRGACFRLNYMTNQLYHPDGNLLYDRVDSRDYQDTSKWIRGVENYFYYDSQRNLYRVVSLSPKGDTTFEFKSKLIYHDNNKLQLKCDSIITYEKGKVFNVESKIFEFDPNGYLYGLRYGKSFVRLYHHSDGRYRRIEFREPGRDTTRIKWAIDFYYRPDNQLDSAMYRFNREVQIDTLGKGKPQLSAASYPMCVTHYDSLGRLTYYDIRRFEPGYWGEAWIISTEKGGFIYDRKGLPIPCNVRFGKYIPKYQYLYWDDK